MMTERIPTQDCHVTVDTQLGTAGDSCEVGVVQFQLSGGPRETEVDPGVCSFKSATECSLKWRWL